MSPTLLYFGFDTCHRLSVLARTGYFIENCGSLVELAAALDSGSEVTAVLMTDRGGHLPQAAIDLTRSRSSALLILFRDSNLARANSSFDLVIPSLTPPEEWLTQIADLIEQSRLLDSNSQPPNAELGTSLRVVHFLQHDAD
jgi:hypothetical protein